MKRVEYIAALRQLADYLESHEITDTYKNRWSGKDEDLFSAPHLEVYTDNKELFGNICGAMGSFIKEVSDYSTGAVHKLPSGAYFGVRASRSVVCKRVIVGTKTVPAKEEEIIPAEPEHEEEIVKWECPESFIDLGKEEVNA